MATKKIKNLVKLTIVLLIVTGAVLFISDYTPVLIKKILHAGWSIGFIVSFLYAIGKSEIRAFILGLFIITFGRVIFSLSTFSVMEIRSDALQITIFCFAISAICLYHLTLDMVQEKQTTPEITE
jgi:hypothetical protein